MHADRRHQYRSLGWAEFVTSDALVWQHRVVLESAAANGRSEGRRPRPPLACDAGYMVFNMNVGGGQSIFAQSSTRLNELDAELRDKHTGKPAEDIKPLVLLALRRIGVSLSDAELVAYADAVSRGEKFRFHSG
jgi:hypothetical protein